MSDESAHIIVSAVMRRVAQWLSMFRISRRRSIIARIRIVSGMSSTVASIDFTESWTVLATLEL